MPQLHAIQTLTTVIDVSGYCDVVIHYFTFAECLPLRLSFFFSFRQLLLHACFSTVCRSIMWQSLQYRLFQKKSTWQSLWVGLTATPHRLRSLARQYTNAVAPTSNGSIATFTTPVKFHDSNGAYDCGRSLTWQVCSDSTFEPWHFTPYIADRLWLLLLLHPGCTFTIVLVL